MKNLKMHILRLNIDKIICDGGDYMRALDSIVLTLVIIGAINWGLIGFFNFNLVNTLFGGMEWLEKTIYAIVGVAGIYSIMFYGKDRVRDQLC